MTLTVPSGFFWSMKRLLLLLFFSCHIAGAQKVVKKAILNPDILAVEIDAKNCFEIKMRTSNTKELMVLAIIDGEYENELLLQLEEKGSSISVSAGFSPNFKNPNDKLSAHKVVSIALEITVPEFQNIQVNGTSCNVIATGIYEQLKITLNDGSCSLMDVSEKVTAITQSGDINVESKSAEIKATSKFGKVQKNEIPTGNNYFMLTTTTGDINLTANR